MANAECSNGLGPARWKKILPFVKSYLGNSLHMLGTTTDSTLIAFILRRIRASLPLLGACDRLQKKYLKASRVPLRNPLVQRTVSSCRKSGVV